MSRQDAASAALAPEDRRPGGHSRLLARVPTPVLVAVVGTLVTALLIPAFTRQWQDRQKARELKALVVTRINGATADAVINSAFIAANRLPSGSSSGFDQEAFNRLDLKWRQDGAAIEAQLRAYFPSSLVADWRSYQELVLNTYFLLTDRMFLRPETLAQIRMLGVSGEILDALSRPWTGTGRQRTAYFWIYRAVLDARTQIIDDVMSAEPEGFSTTTGDILRDLVPLG
jgi:hypothetical protein